MNHQPEIKANSLIKQVESLFDAAGRDEFTIAKLKTEAKHLVSSDPFNGKRLLGRLAALEHRVEEMRSNHLSSIKLQPNNPEGLASYSASLDYLGYFSEAREFGEKAFELSQGNSKLLNNIIEASIHSGRYRDALEYINKWNALFPKDAHQFSHLIFQMTEFLNSHDITDDFVENYQEIVSDLMHESEIYTFEGRADILEDEDSVCLSIMIESNKSLEDIVQMNIKLAEIIARTELPDHLTDHVNYVFVTKN